MCLEGCKDAPCRSHLPRIKAVAQADEAIAGTRTGLERPGEAWKCLEVTENGCGPGNTSDRKKRQEDGLCVAENGCNGKRAPLEAGPDRRTAFVGTGAVATEN